jgi:hypothetical protein
MSACPKIVFEDENVPAAGGDLQPMGEAPSSLDLSVSADQAARSWWHGAIHLVALMGLLGLCALLSLVGLLWFSLAIEPG